MLLWPDVVVHLTHSPNCLRRPRQPNKPWLIHPRELFAGQSLQNIVDFYYPKSPSAEVLGF